MEITDEPYGDFGVGHGEELEKIAARAFIFMYPIVLNYKAICTHSKSHPFNQFVHMNKFLDDKFAQIVTPNCDTLYSTALLDMRSQPIVLSLPEVPDDRYYSIQLIDGYTHNFAILGSRTTGNKQGHFLIVGPNWSGDVPDCICQVHMSESEFGFIIGRTMAKDAKEDIHEVQKIQKGYTITLMSSFFDLPPPPVKEVPNFLPVKDSDLLTPNIFKYANYAMQFVKIHPSERDLFDRFAKVGVIPGAEFVPSGKILQALEEGVRMGMLSAETSFDKDHHKGAWRTSIFPPRFGNRSVMKGKYRGRFIASCLYLYGLDPEESIYYKCLVDRDGNTLDASKHMYVLTFSKDKIPIVKGFWSITIYNELLLFVDNPLNRYSIGDRTRGLQYNEDGSLAIYIQKEKPPNSHNWLPAPDGLFTLNMRLYWPAEEMVLLPYYPPPVCKV